MKGRQDFQGEMFCYISLEERVSATNPLRKLRGVVDARQATMDNKFEAAYARRGRPRYRRRFRSRLFFCRVGKEANFCLESFFRAFIANLSVHDPNHCRLAHGALRNQIRSHNADLYSSAEIPYHRSRQLGVFSAEFLAQVLVEDIFVRYPDGIR